MTTENQTYIPEGWKSNKLGTICKVQKGVQFNKIELAEYGLYPCINGGIEPSGYSDLWNTNEDTITISEGGNSCGYVNFQRTKFWCGGHCYTLLNVQDGLDYEFLFWALKGKQDLIMDLRVGSGLPNIQQKAIKEFSFISPISPTEQQKIASILSKLDEAITQTEQLIGKYKKIKEGLMHDLLTRGTDDQGKIRSEETHRFKDSPLGRIPEEWECVTIGDIIEKLRSGVTPRGGSEIYQKEGIMFLRSQNIYPYGFELEDVAYISHAINNKMLRSELKELDVLLNITGASIGRSTYVPAGFPTANVNQHVCSIRIYNPSEEKSIFLSSFLNSVYGQNQIAQHNAGSNRQGLNYSQIKQIYIPDFKSDYELSNFKITINKIENTINQYKNNLTKLQLKKSGLMNDLLTGKIRVQI